MPDPTPEDSLHRSVKHLTRAVWVLVVLIALQLLISLWGRVQLGTNIEHFVESTPVHFSSSPSTPRFDSYNNFHEWPVEKQIENANVIALATWKRDGERIRCVFTEILKHRPGVTFHYKVGDEYHPGTRWTREDASYGDGQIIFFTGSPASMKMSMSYDNGRVLGMGDMPLEMLRETIGKQAK